MDFNQKFTKSRLSDFADMLMDMHYNIGFKVSSRGWCYLMEQAGHIDKSQFGKIEDVINRCRREGILPVDFVAEEDARAFSGVHVPTEGSVDATLKWMMSDVLEGHRYYTPDWWVGEDYYIQILVEKIDLKTVFKGVTERYHAPIANAKGWSSILQRAEYSRRFKEAEDRGMQCVLIYCGDHDPDGLRISDTIRKNLEQIKDVKWGDGQRGYDPSSLIIDRIGLNFDFIKENKFTWIDNLITGSGKNLASRSHPNHRLPYVQEYLGTVGERKCEANVMVTSPSKARELITDSLTKYLGTDALNRFKLKEDAVEAEYKDLLAETGLSEIINKLL